MSCQRVEQTVTLPSHLILYFDQISVIIEILYLRIIELEGTSVMLLIRVANIHSILSRGLETYMDNQLQFSQRPYEIN